MFLIFLLLPRDHPCAVFDSTAAVHSVLCNYVETDRRYPSGLPTRHRTSASTGEGGLFLRGVDPPFENIDAAHDVRIEVGGCRQRHLELRGG
jgi:hypothetical protein